MNLHTFVHLLRTGRAGVHRTVHLRLVSHHLKCLALSAQGAKIGPCLLVDDLAELAGDLALRRFIDLDLDGQRYHL